MSETWDSRELARKMLEIFPRFGRLMAAHMTALAENETTMMQMATLHLLSESCMTTSELAKHRKVSLQAASTLVQSLVDRGLVVRVEDPNDRRRAMLQVTEAGLEEAETAREKMTAHLAAFIDDLTSEEIAAAQTFLTGLQRIVRQSNLDAIKHEIIGEPHRRGM